jgi:hypothetical protein
MHLPTFNLLTFQLLSQISLILALNKELIYG